MEKGCLGLIAAMPQEIAPLLRRVGRCRKEQSGRFNLYSFEVQGAPVTLIESGMGPAHARAATLTLIEAVAPSLVVNFGLAGAVQPGLVVGDLILAERVLWLERGVLREDARGNPRLSSMVADGCAGSSIAFKRGTFITAAAIMKKKEVSVLLGSALDHPVLEMETAAVFAAAAERGVPAVGLRGVSDGAEEELAFSLEEFCDAELRLSVPRVIRSVCRKPWIVPQLLRLAGNSKRGAERVAEGVEAALKALAAAEVSGICP